MQHSIAFAPRLTYKRHPLIKGEKALLCFKNLTCWASSNARYQAGFGVPKGCGCAQGHLPASDTRAGSYLWQEVLSRAPHTPHLLISNNQDTDNTLRNVRLHWKAHAATHIWPKAKTPALRLRCLGVLRGTPFSGTLAFYILKTPIHFGRVYVLPFLTTLWTLGFLLVYVILKTRYTFLNDL